MNPGLCLSALLLLLPQAPHRQQAQDKAARQDKTDSPEPTANLVWKLPGYSYVQYRRTPAGWRRGSLGTRVTAGFYSPALSKNREVRFSRSDLADLLPMLALSLSGRVAQAGTGQDVSRKFDCIRAGRIWARGKIQTLSSNVPRRVRQSGSFRIQSLEKPGGRFESRRRRLQRAKIEFTREVDTLSGRVLSFTGSTQGSFRARKGEKPQEFDHRETWTFARIHRPDTPAFRKLVNDAIERGQKWLSQATITGTGPKALALLTLCKNNPYRDQAAIQRLLEDVRSSDVKRTYELAVSIQAIESFYESPQESARIRAGEQRKPSPIRLSAEDRKLMDAWLKRLLANRSTSGGNRWRFHYRRGGNFDNSNTQFAALGLQAAERCGLKVPMDAWMGLARHFSMERLDVNEGWARIRLTTYGELAHLKKQGKPSRVTSTSGPEVKIRGFSYRKPEGTTAGKRAIKRNQTTLTQAYGSMTCAGVTGLTIAGASIRRRKPRAGAILGKIEKARLGGFAWLLENYEVRRNPGRTTRWYYYYLYSLERTCELGGVARIQDRHWYFDGAMQILTLQASGGAFRPVAGTRASVTDACFAILFLKRAVAPVSTR